MDELDHLGWVVQRTYEIGPWILGIRTNSEAVGTWLDEWLGDFETGDPSEPVFSIFVPESGKVGRRFHVLYEESRQLVRSFSLAHIGRRLLSELEGYVAAGRRDALYMRMPLVRYGGRTALLPGILVPYLMMMGSRAERRGLYLPDHSYVAIDLESGLVRTASDPLLGLDVDAAAAALAALADPDGPPDEPPLPEPPQRPDVLFSVGVEDEPVLELSPAQATYMAGHHAINLAVVGEAGLVALGRLAHGPRCLQIRSSNTKQTLEHVCLAIEDPDAALLLRDED